MSTHNYYIEAGNFTITLVNVSNITVGRSTLEVMSDDLIENETTLTCTAGGNQKQLVISKLGKSRV